MNYNFLFWMFLIISSLLLELGHPGLFFFLAFSLGAGVALSITMLNGSLLDQLIGMCTATFIAMFLLHHFLKKTKQLGHSHEPKTNVYALQGKIGVALTDITDQGLGRIKVNTEEWSARSLKDDYIQAGTSVEILAVRGCHCIVKHIR